MPDTDLGITYPASTGHTRLWEHLQTLATTVNTALKKAREPAHAVLAKTAAQSIANSSNVTVIYGVTETSRNCTISLAGGTVTIVEGGLYLIAANIAYVNNTTGARELFLQLNGTTFADETRTATTGSFGTGLSCSAVKRLVPGDVIRVQTSQYSGGALNTNSSHSRTRLSVLRVGD